MSENEYDLTTAETVATAEAPPTEDAGETPAPAPKAKVKAPKAKAAAPAPKGKGPTPKVKATAPAGKPASPKELAAKAKANGTASKTKATEDGVTGGERTGPKKKEGLRDAQVRILHYLARSGEESDRAEIASGAPCDVFNCVELLGSHDAAKREANDVKHFPSLLTLGYVKATVGEGSNGRQKVLYKITPEGKKVAAKLPPVKAKIRK